MSLGVGEIFGGYTVVRLLGSGGMGEVYLAKHPRLPRQDALKVLPAAVSTDQEFRARFEREADLAATLWHPHIVGVHDRGEADGRLWIAMDYVAGYDASRLQREQFPAGMPAEQVGEIITAVAEALDYAHDLQLLHRDVKPANILLSEDRGPKRRILLADFGIARHAEDSTGLTATNMTVGSVNYTAPEQLIGENIDGRADQYALAATAYHLLTGRPPFPNTNPAVVISRHLHTPPPLLATTHPELSALHPVLATALAKDPEHRYPSCTDFAAALTAAAAGTSSVPSSSTSTSAAPVLTTAPTTTVPVENPTTYLQRPAQQPAPIHVSTWGTTQDATPVESRPMTSPSPAALPQSAVPPASTGKSSAPKELLRWGGAVAAIIVLVATIALTTNKDTTTTSSGASSTTPAAASTSTHTTTVTTANPPTTSRTPLPPSATAPAVTPSVSGSPGSYPTIADYIKQNGITETPVRRGDPGTPLVDLPIPSGWQDAGNRTPNYAWSALLYAGDPAMAADPPTIVALMSRLTGNVDSDQIMSYAPGELKNLPGFEGGDGNASTLSGFEAFQIGGTYIRDGVKRMIAQKTVTISSRSGFYVLQLNADGLEDQIGPLIDATDVIDERTVITP